MAHWIYLYCIYYMRHRICVVQSQSYINLVLALLSKWLSEEEIDYEILNVRSINLRMTICLFLVNSLDVATPLGSTCDHYVN